MSDQTDQTDQTDQEDEERERRLLERRLSRAGKGICTGCERPFDSGELVSLRVIFHSNRAKKTLKSRTMGRLCPYCLEDNEWWTSGPRYV
jgi:hypothetical protein